MKQSGVRKWVLCMLFAVGMMLFAAPATAGDPRGELRKMLHDLFGPSGIELQDPARRGAVVRRGRVLTLSAEVPAKPFRVVQADRNSPAFHVMDFARVEVAADGRVQTEPASLRLAAGTPLVVLEVKVERDRVRLLTHTAEPQPVALGERDVYGCTEFVFRLAPHALEADAVARVLQTIARWLTPTSEERVCSPGIDQLCIEP